MTWLNDASYLSLATFRKSGAEVRTAVWFAKDGAASGSAATAPTTQPPALSDVLAAPAAELLPASLSSAADHHAVIQPVHVHASVIKDDEFKQTPLI